MSTPDISRQFTQPEKRYVGAFMQQGRVVTDEDLNAHRRLDAEDERRTLQDIICAKGSPNHGFRIQNIDSVNFPINNQNVVDFSIHHGSFYIGGLRFEALEDQPENFLSQRDWLQIDADPNLLPSTPTLADLTDLAGNFFERSDLVFLTAWEQCVSAVEDRELLEYALGGPDTSVYQKRFRQIDILEDVAEECAEAFAQLRELLAAPFPDDLSGVPHRFDDSSCELISKSLLTVGFSGGGPSDDLCQPPVLQGYLGAENQAIRIQLTATNHFIWGFDNASPLYRVRVIQEAGLDRIEFLTLPKDEFAQPVSGQAVEILPWGSLLPNQEKTAELQGHLTTVATSFDPTTNSLTIEDGIPQAMLDWLDDPAHAGFLNDRDEPENQRYFYLRLWTGGTGDAVQPDHDFTPGNPVQLGVTGLEVTFSDFGLPGAYWVIAARPNTPDEVVPWKLTENSPPFGPRQFIAPLALIRWAVENNQVVGTLVDCRTRFRPLCQLKGCCTIIVGDGSTSHGEFTSIQDAIDALPPAGGEICVLLGRYEAHFRIQDRSNIKIKGCGPDTLIVAQDDSPVVEIIDSHGIEISDLAIEAEATRAIICHGSNLYQAVTNLTFTHLDIRSRDLLSIGIVRSQNVKLIHNRIRVSALAAPLPNQGPVGREPAIFLAGDDILVEQNRIIADESTNALQRGFGGLHIGGGSERVEIRRNVITGGNNHGITLGTVVTTNAATPNGNNTLTNFPSFGGFIIVIDENGCIRIIPIPPEGGPDDPGTNTEAGPALRDLRIIDNLISGMGMSGISVVRFFDMENNPDFITVERLSILENRIHGCMRLELGNLPPELSDVSAIGGIILGDVERLNLRDNEIEKNGAGGVEPICGVFVLHGEGMAIDGNKILYNGTPDDDLQLQPKPGRRGGIVLAFARSPATEVAPFGTNFSGKRQDGFPAAHIHDNIVVSPQGRALEIMALGPVSVEGNELTAKGGTFRNPFSQIPENATTGGPQGAATSSNPLLAFLDLLGGSAVSIFNLGVSNEFYLQLFGLSGLFLLDDLPTEEAVDNVDDPRFFVGGNILFNDNQVVLDAFGPGITFSMSSILLISLDDISMNDNQCDCDLLLDFVITHSLLLGFSVRAADNRLKEGFFNAFLSGLTFGLMNSTNANVSTHCIVPIGLPNLTYTAGNVALVEISNEGACANFRELFGSLLG